MVIQRHRFNAGAAHHVDEFVEGHAAVLNEFYRGQRSLAVADQNSVSELALADLSLLFNRMVVSFQGGSSRLYLESGGTAASTFQLRERHLLRKCRAPRHAGPPLLSESRRARPYPSGTFDPSEREALTKPGLRYGPGCRGSTGRVNCLIVLSILSTVPSDPSAPTV
jgi:hypothetical protein